LIAPNRGHRDQPKPKNAQTPQFSPTFSRLSHLSFRAKQADFFFPFARRERSACVERNLSSGFDLEGRHPASSVFEGAVLEVSYSSAPLLPSTCDRPPQNCHPDRRAAASVARSGGTSA
jgi:hypothetical protein